MARLRRSHPSQPGLRRVRRGRGFSYLDADGSVLTDAGERERIAALAIPPAWKDVWICPDPRGHLQAVGVDAAGRRQYRYHPEWRARRDREKFESMFAFAGALPAMRRAVRRDLAQPGLPRERVLACAVRLLDLGFFRVGSEDYAEQNDTYGLATLRKDHVRLEGDRVVFDYRAKSGKQRIQAIADADVLEIVGQLKRRRGGSPELLAYRRSRSEWADIRSDDVNRYLKELTGGDFSAKDFRTWNGTVLAAVALAQKSDMVSRPTSRKRAIAQTVREVAFYLGNTPAVARSSYIDPRVFDRFESGWTIEPELERLGGPESFIDPRARVRLEEAVIDLLREEEESPALAKAA